MIEAVDIIYKLAVAAGIFGAGLKSLAPHLPAVGRWVVWAAGVVRRSR